MKLRFTAVRNFLSFKPETIVRDGELLRGHINSIKHTPEDALSRLRAAGCLTFSEVKCAIDEPNGEISMFKDPSK